MMMFSRMEDCFCGLGNWAELSFRIEMKFPLYADQIVIYPMIHALIKCLLVVVDICFGIPQKAIVPTHETRLCKPWEEEESFDLDRDRISMAGKTWTHSGIVWFVLFHYLGTHSVAHLVTFFSTTTFSSETRLLGWKRTFISFPYLSPSISPL